MDKIPVGDEHQEKPDAKSKGLRHQSSVRKGRSMRTIRSGRTQTGRKYSVPDHIRNEYKD